MDYSKELIEKVEEYNEYLRKQCQNRRDLLLDLDQDICMRRLFCLLHQGDNLEKETREKFEYFLGKVVAAYATFLVSSGKYETLREKYRIFT